MEGILAMGYLHDKKNQLCNFDSTYIPLNDRADINAINFYGHHRS